MKKIFTVLTLMLVMASFSSNAQQKDEAWLEYDNGVFMTDIGLLTGDPIYWGNMFTPSQLADFDGYQLIKVKIWDHTPYNGYLIIYQDNSETGPAEMVYMQQYSVEGTNDWTEIELNTPVVLDVTKNLWITFNNSDGEFTIPAADDCGDANSRWISEDGREWADASTVGMPPFTWLIRGLISNEGLSVIELGAGFHPDMSGRDNIYTNASIFGLSKKEIDARLDDIITFSELEEFIDNPVRTYSSGMYMRLAFSVAINVDADVLLIDEILAVGDSNFQAKCFAKLRDLKAKGITIVIVTHDSGTIQSFCDRAIWIEDGHVQFDGESTKAIDKYLEYMSNEKRERMLDEEDKARVKAMKAKAEHDQLIKETGDERATLDQSNNRFGVFNGEITKAYMLNEKGKETWIHETNKPCKLVMEYKINRNSQYGFVFGMGFSTRDGKLIYGTNTQLDGLKVKCEVGQTGIVTFDIPSLPLLKGEYSVNVSIVDENGTPLDFYREYAVLNVVSDIKSPGTTLIPHKWDIK